MAAHIGQRGKSMAEKRESHLEAIQVTKVLNRLIKHVDGEAEMSSTQVRAAEILLRKKLPDLKATELTGADGKALAVNVTRYSDPDNPE